MQESKSQSINIRIDYRLLQINILKFETRTQLTTDTFSVIEDDFSYQLLVAANR